MIGSPSIRPLIPQESIESVPESRESVPESIESSQYRETLRSRNFKAKDDHQLSESERNQLVSKAIRTKK